MSSSSTSQEENDKKPILHKEYFPIFGKDKLGKTRIWKATIFSFLP